jgi:hypothetical protein
MVTYKCPLSDAHLPDVLSNVSANFVAIAACRVIVFFQSTCMKTDISSSDMHHYPRTDTSDTMYSRTYYHPDARK